jgi:DNA-binding MarR family transcriptional regulator
MPQELMPLGRSIGRAHKFVRAWGDRELAPLGASVTDWILLFHIHSTPPPGLSQTEIARFSDMGGPALVRYLDRYERDGLVERARDASDRRVTRVTLTAAGEARLDELRPVMERTDATLRSLLTAKEAAVLQDALDRIFAFALGELLADAPAPIETAPARSAPTAAVPPTKPVQPAKPTRPKSGKAATPTRSAP